METGILSKILKRFIVYLEDLPANLRLFCFSALFFFITIDIAITIYNHLGDENFSYIAWAKNKILKVGFIMFMLYKYEWIMEGVKSFFFYAVEKAIRSPVLSGDYIDNPSYLYDQGVEIARKVFDVIGYNPKTWIYIVLGTLIWLGFLMISIQLIICWIEFYFLTGFSIIFLPFGVLDVTLDFYRNVFKTIAGACIKLAVLAFWVKFSSVILSDLAKVSDNIDVQFTNIATLAGVVYVLMAIMTVLPSMTSGLLTGSPTVNASAAMAGAKGAAMGLFTTAAHIIRGTKETAVNTYQGARTGAQIGGKAGEAFGGAVGGGAGAAIGKVVVGGAGAVVGGVGKGTYAGVKYAAFHEKHSERKNKLAASGSPGGKDKGVSSTDTSSAGDAGAAT